MTEDQKIHSDDIKRQLGLKLIETREALGLSQLDVGAELKILTAAIEALETGNYTAIKSKVFVKGYLKAYIKFLNLDLDEHMALYQQTLVADEEPVPVLSLKKMTDNNVPNYLKFIIPVLVLLAWLLVSFLSGSDTPEALSSNVVESEVGATTALEAVAPVLAPKPNIENYEPLAFIATSDDAEQELVGGSTDLLEGTASLKLVFSGECWIEVVDATGTRLLADLKMNHDEVNLVGQPPFDLLVGYGPAVSIFYQNEAYAFEVNRSNPTMKLRVGEPL